jgi:hypothetical protein
MGRQIAPHPIDDLPTVSDINARRTAYLKVIGWGWYYL